MAIITRMGYIILDNIIAGKLATLVAIFVGVLSYVILLFLTGTLDEDDFRLIPNGDKIVRKLKKSKILK